jgi:predicted ATPase
LSYQFNNLQLQQAAYSLISASEKLSIHLKIGRILLNNTHPASLPEKISIVVNQMNLGVELITEAQQREELARLNLLAGKKAKSSVAYEAALKASDIIPLESFIAIKPEIERFWL